MESTLTIKPTNLGIGTSLQGFVIISYADLVSVFGTEHSGASADDKVLAEWEFEFPDGTIATIYNWKDGKNYDPVDGLDKEDILKWHVGGVNNKAVDLVALLLSSKSIDSGYGYPNMRGN